jgi:hypothetical protein
MYDHALDLMQVDAALEVQLDEPPQEVHGGRLDDSIVTLTEIMIEADELWAPKD